MNDWFAVEKIDGDTFAISEYKHWEETHCYLLRGENGALLIDTGLGICNVKEIVDQLTDLPVTVVSTHVHWDHIGGHRYFENVAVHEYEKNWLSLRFPLPIQVVKENLTRIPFEYPSGFHPDDYRVFCGEPQRILRDGDSFDLGGREVRVIHTPGHSPGHCCFYETGRNYLYSGDLIYSGCLDAFYPTTDPQQFYESVKRILGLQISRVLPGHHSLNIPVSLIDKVHAAFERLHMSGQLTQGKGIFDFGDFQIHI